MISKKVVLTSAVATLMSSSVLANNCGPTDASIRVLANDFPAIHALVSTAKNNCKNYATKFTINHTAEARQIMNAALTPTPAEYTSVIVANATLVQLMNDGLVRPLDEYVEKYGQNLKKHQLITINGKVMAIAFMANSQHLFSRSDILKQAGIKSIPSTYEEVLDAAEAIRTAGIMEHPLVMNLKKGWNQGEVFNTLYLAHGGQFFKSGTAEVSINNEQGIAALKLMKALTQYANPDFLTQASNETQGLWEAGKAALGIMWGSRGEPILDDQGSTIEVTSNTVLSGAPTVAGGSTPAATLWWDGVTIAKNIPDADAEATFAALASAMTPDMVAAHNDDAVWLIDGFKPGPNATGISATVRGGAKSYPMFPQMGILHSAVGNELSDFLKGDESAEQALADVEAAYNIAAKEKGFL
ncbi:ABC transporter substrate-binding protein [Marinomonas sp. PE14-40]|uniref:ABC transporter substrate-binding protein n=1 Tax=Marinomonas sp. PE14-40 TaxID=3060621 RepID=UPI003F67B8ED